MVKRNRHQFAPQSVALVALEDIDALDFAVFLGAHLGMREVSGQAFEIADRRPIIVQGELPEVPVIRHFRPQPPWLIGSIEIVGEIGRRIEVAEGFRERRPHQALEQRDMFGGRGDDLHGLP